jgi:hypothetical protein
VNKEINIRLRIPVPPVLPIRWLIGGGLVVFASLGFLWGLLYLIAWQKLLLWRLESIANWSPIR